MLSHIMFDNHKVELGQNFVAKTTFAKHIHKKLLENNRDGKDTRQFPRQ